MRKSFLPLSLATGTAVLLSACGSQVPLMNGAGGYPTGGYSTGQAAPASVGTVATAPAALEFGRIADIQAVSQGVTSATNPNASRAVVGGILGAVVGSVIGKNIDNGHSREGTTVLGGAAGAAIGSGMGRSQPQQQAAAPAWRISVQTDQGQWRTYEVAAPGDLRVGDRVRIENGVIYKA